MLATTPSWQATISLYGILAVTALGLKSVSANGTASASGARDLL
jgi:hypothetical protein